MKNAEFLITSLFLQAVMTRIMVLLNIIQLRFGEYYLFRSFNLIALWTLTFSTFQCCCFIRRRISIIPLISNVKR